jgi:hypothetical protein
VIAVLTCRLPAWLMSRCRAEIARSASSLFSNCEMGPTTMRRCLRAPSGPGSRHRYSQTGPPCLRSAQIRLPYCISSSSTANRPMEVEHSPIPCRHNPGTKWTKRESGQGVLAADLGTGYRFPAEVPHLRACPARLGLSRTTLITRMRKLGISPNDYA